MSESLPCVIYRSLRKDGLYLFVLEEGNFETVPENVMQHIGQMEKAMELELTPGRKLARGDATEVINNLKQRGFHIQMPPQDDKLPLAKSLTGAR